jgi:uncharacterized protein YdhG (YjbR/CyaY superfamily)
MNDVDEYIASFPGDIREILTRIRNIIRKYAPDAEESISYKMPAYKTFGKTLIYFAGFNNHIGLYATPSGHLAFKNELAKYKQGKGSVQFPTDKPIPYDLIRMIVEFRVEENKVNFQSGPKGRKRR